jgi:phosphoglycolate phosphatase
MPSSLPALIFDLDGTLTDSKPGILGCLQKIIDQRNLGDCGPLDRFVGPPVEEWCIELLPNGTEEDQAQMARDYRACYDREGWSNNSVYPGIREALETLAAIGHPLYVCTSKLQHFAERILDHFNLSPLFKAIYGDRSEFEDHSKPLLLARLLREQALDPAHTWMIGDRIHDIEAARANHVHVLLAGWGYGSLEERAQADAVSPIPADLAPLVRLY